MATPEEVRSQLAEFARQLRALKETEQEFMAGRMSAPSISFDLIDLVADAVEQYLGGKKASLDHAFGLRRRGRPKADLARSKYFALAEKAVLGRMCGRTWRQLCDELNFSDQRELQRIEKRYRTDVLKKFSKQLNDRLNRKQAARPAAHGRPSKSLSAKRKGR